MPDAKDQARLILLDRLNDEQIAAVSTLSRGHSAGLQSFDSSVTQGLVK